MDNIQTGREFLDEFFKGLGSTPGIDQAVAGILSGLYEKGKLTPTNVSNELEALRGEASGQNK